jgi:hypothetical protein
VPKGSTKYDPGIHPTLCYYLAKDGLILAQIAERLGVSDRTLDAWVAKYPELREAMRPGKEYIDNLVEGSLLKRARGYDIVEVTRERVAETDSATGRVRHSLKVTKKVTKHVPAEVAAAIFWLKNRKGWRDKVDIDHTVHDHRQDLANLTDDELTTMRALQAKLEASVAGRN